VFGLPADYLLYGVCLGLSLLMGVMSAMSGADFDLDSDVGADHAASYGSAGVPRYSLFNPVAMLAFLGGFGAGGFIGRGAGLGTLPAFGLALAAGGLLSVALFTAFARLVLGSQGGEAHATEQAVGKLATVTTAIPASGLGAVAYEADGRRQTISARPVNDQPLARGLEVVIVSFDHHVALVRPFKRQ
jgi:membrane protein implicated in regulation of membrane protease activity